MVEYGLARKEDRKGRIYLAIGVIVLVTAGGAFATRVITARSINQGEQRLGTGSTVGSQSSPPPLGAPGGTAPPPSSTPTSIPSAGNPGSAQSPNGLIPSETFSQQFRDTSLFPPVSELASLQAQAASSGRADLKDPRRVAEQYLRILYRGTLAAEQNEFGLGEYERSPAGVADDSGPVPFAGAHDVGPGAVHLSRYSWPEGQPDDIWYVTGAVSDFVIGGGEALGDKFEGARFRQFLLPQKDGTLHVFVATFGERIPLIDETYELKAQAYFKVERTFSKKHPVLYLQAQLRSTDGRIGIFETSIPNNENP